MKLAAVLPKTADPCKYFKRNEYSKFMMVAGKLGVLRKSNFGDGVPEVSSFILRVNWPKKRNFKWDEQRKCTTKPTLYDQVTHNIREGPIGGNERGKSPYLHLNSILGFQALPVGMVLPRLSLKPIRIVGEPLKHEGKRHKSLKKIQENCMKV